MAELKANKYGNIYSPNSLALPIGRAVFINLAAPSKSYNKYGCTILFKKDDKSVMPLLKALKADFQKLVVAKYGAKAPGLSAPAIGDGDTSPTSASNSAPVGETYSDFKSCYYIRLNSKAPVRVVDANNKDLDPAKITAGVLVDGVAQCMLYDKGCSWRPLVIRLVRDDGTRIHTGPNPLAQLTKLSAEFADEPVGGEIVVNNVELSEDTLNDTDKQLLDTL